MEFSIGNFLTAAFELIVIDDLVGYLHDLCVHAVLDGKVRPLVRELIAHSFEKGDANRVVVVFHFNLLIIYDVYLILDVSGSGDDGLELKMVTDEDEASRSQNGGKHDRLDALGRLVHNANVKLCRFAVENHVVN